MIDIRKRILELLDKTHLMSIGTVDENGVWVADVVYIHDDDLNIYWLSHPLARHSQSILKNKKAAGTITHSTKSKELNFCIQFEGIAEKINEERFDLIIKHLTKRSHQIPHISEAAKILKDDSWYKITPVTIHLIDEENFGFDRQELRLDK